MEIEELEDIAEPGQVLIARALRSISVQLKYLGNADAATPMGALEALGAVMKDSLDGLASSMDGVATAIQEAGSN